MKKSIHHLLALAATAVMVGFVSNQASAQDQADREQRRANALKNYRDRIEVKSEEDWKKIEPLVAKVMDAQRETFRGAGFGGFGGFGNRGGGGGGGGGNDQGGRARGAGQSNPDREALQKALEDKESADVIKAKLAKLRESRKEKEAALEKAQAELQKALTPKQEAGAVLAGLLR